MIKKSNSFNTNDAILDKQFIDSFIIDLNTELSKRNKNLEITIYGGSCLCLLTAFRTSTYDIDTKSTDDRLLEECVQSLGLTKDLVNTEISVFMNGKESLEIYKSMSHLTVKLPTLEYLLALKCKACRGKDLDDVKHLCKLLSINTMDELYSNFRKFYSPVLFNYRRIKILEEVFR